MRIKRDYRGGANYYGEDPTICVQVTQLGSSHDLDDTLYIIRTFGVPDMRLTVDQARTLTACLNAAMKRHKECETSNALRRENHRGNT